ncbi:phosphomethylpyrimidine synthase [Candidatus Termititenax persephonae]|uniref:Phosphomethylpyrimidine synthase n=1 Tax=Candidatus Termititenax persephonae TaxID=2218525 RepID=A0A388TIK3_9BACT|nr:phosphomethylpyrimidine synthase [Candidatus Termititenax persephonae]
MTTQREYAWAGKITPQMEQAAEQERIPVRQILRGLRSGQIALVKNKNRAIRPMAVGAGCLTKVNANIGTSRLRSTLKAELVKLKACEKYGADAVMDLSTGGQLDKTRQALLSATKLCFGTVPIYQLMCEKSSGFQGDDLLDVIRKHCAQGVDFITVHCGVTREVASLLRRYPRVTGVVSRGGSFLHKWLNRTGRENPLYERFDELCALAYEYDVTLSLGDGLRPGCLADAHDRAQIKELEILGKLARRAWRKNVQVIVEGPGHVPYNQIARSMRLEKKLCRGAPFYVLGPLPTDIAAGYDHIAGAIGGTLAAVNGADFLCYVTPAEHLGLPDGQDVRDGIIASRIAAHSADLVKYPERSADRDLAMAKARKALDWDKQIKLALDSEKARSVRKAKGQDLRECTMCGDLCSMKDL